MKKNQLVPLGPSSIACLCFLFFFLTAVLVRGQVENTGPVISYKKIPGGIRGKTKAGIFEVRAWSAGCIRVRVSRGADFNKVSYALASDQAPDFTALQFKDLGKTLELVTSSLRVEIEQSPYFRLIFKTSSGKVINEDFPGAIGGTSFQGEKLTVYKKLQPGEHFIGMGEALGDLDRRGTGVTLNNTDTYKYGDPRLPMYSSIPFYMGIQQQLVYGIFHNNTHKAFFNFGLSTPEFSSAAFEGGDADYFFFYGPDIPALLNQYALVTGKMPLPPLWSLGYQQSRCSYYPQAKVKWLAETFRAKQLPVDGIVLDADYLQDYEPFRINQNRFPDMAGLAAEMDKLGIELTASVNPGIKLDSSYEAHQDGLQQDVFVKYADGSLFVSDIAPSTNHFVDFTAPRARHWWADKMQFLPRNGIHGYWNDMNEPATAGSYLPDNLRFDFEGRKATTAEAKNVYGLLMARSSYESAIQYGGGRRPFVLTRSGFAGVQRYSAVWSGDNTASNEGLLSGFLLNSQLGLSGVAFAGMDLGGYIGDGNKDLFRRWLQAGIFSPYLRNHKEFFAAANEPWSYGEEVEAIARNYLGLRYRLMPYLYSKFYEAATTGLPVARSLCISQPFDERVYDKSYQYEFLFGDAILVVPLTPAEASKKIYLPAGQWYDLFSDRKLAGSQELVRESPSYQIPLFIRGGSILPMQGLVQSTRDKPTDTLYIHVYNGDQKNSFTYYEDDGRSFDYTKGAYLRREIVFDPQGRQLKFSRQQGSYPSQFKYLRIIFHGFGNSINRITSGNNPVTIRDSRIPVLDGLEGLQDYYDPAYYRQLKAAASMEPQQSCILADAPEILLQW